MVFLFDVPDSTLSILIVHVQIAVSSRPHPYIKFAEIQLVVSVTDRNRVLLRSFVIPENSAVDICDPDREWSAGIIVLMLVL